MSYLRNVHRLSTIQRNRDYSVSPDYWDDDSYQEEDPEEPEPEDEDED